MASLLYRGRLRYYIEDKVGVCIIDSIPHCHTKIFQKRRKSRNVASFLYRGRTKLENLSSIVFHTVLLKMLSKMEKKRYLTSFVHNTKIGVSIIDSIPHCHSKYALKKGKNQEMWLRYYIEDKVGVCIIDSIPHVHTKML